MQECIYRLVKGVLLTEDGNEYLAYGVEAWLKRDNKYILAEFIPNIFFEYDRAKKFIDLCNLLEVSLIHLIDLIEDELS